MERSLGTLVVNEQPYPITGIRLADHRIFFTAKLRAPVGGSLTIHPNDQAVLLAPDGTLVTTCLLLIPRPQTARRGGLMVIDLPLMIDEIVGASKWL